MKSSSLSLQENYWELTQFQDTDLEFLYNHLIEVETPQTTDELLQVLVDERIKVEKKALEQNQLHGSDIYLPKDKYKVGQNLVFPTLNWQKGKVSNVRPGNNPEYPGLEVIEVEFPAKVLRLYAANLENHKLNEPITINLDDPLLNNEFVINKFGDKLIEKLGKALDANPDLIKIANRWFPRTLLVSINIGYLNLAEAVLEMESGGPLTTNKILERIELPSDANKKLLE
jgi:hypothetical protein